MSKVSETAKMQILGILNDPCITVRKISNYGNAADCYAVDDATLNRLMDLNIDTTRFKSLLRYEITLHDQGKHYSHLIRKNAKHHTPRADNMLRIFNEVQKILTASR